MNQIPELELARMLDARVLASRQDAWTEEWHRTPPRDAKAEDFAAAVMAQHYANFELWHLEDAARAPGASDH